MSPIDRACLREDFQHRLKIAASEPVAVPEQSTCVIRLAGLAWGGGRIFLGGHGDLFPLAFVRFFCCESCEQRFAGDLPLWAGTVCRKLLDLGVPTILTGASDAAWGDSGLCS